MSENHTSGMGLDLALVFGCRELEYVRPSSLRCLWCKVVFLWKMAAD